MVHVQSRRPKLHRPDIITWGQWAARNCAAPPPSTPYNYFAPSYLNPHVSSKTQPPAVYMTIAEAPPCLTFSARLRYVSASFSGMRANPLRRYSRSFAPISSRTSTAISLQYVQYHLLFSDPLLSYYYTVITQVHSDSPAARLHRACPLWPPNSRLDCSQLIS
jgi:hypothetical protein